MEADQGYYHDSWRGKMKNGQEQILHELASVSSSVPATASGGDTRGVGIGAVVMGKPSSTTTCSSTNLQCPLISRRQSPLLNVKLAVFGMTFSSKTSKMQNFKSLNPFFAPPCMPNALLKKVLIIWSRGMANPLLFLTNLLRSVMGRLRHRCGWISRCQLSQKRYLLRDHSSSKWCQLRCCLHRVPSGN